MSSTVNSDDITEAHGTSPTTPSPYTIASPSSRATNGDRDASNFLSPDNQWDLNSKQIETDSEAQARALLCRILWELPRRRHRRRHYVGAGVSFKCLCWWRASLHLIRRSNSWVASGIWDWDRGIMVWVCGGGWWCVDAVIWWNYYEAFRGYESRRVIRRGIWTWRFGWRGVWLIRRWGRCEWLCGCVRKS